MVIDKIHFEPYVHLADVTSSTALIGWGGFYFYWSYLNASWKLAHDHQLEQFGIRRSETIGANAEPYGNARVTIFNTDNQVVEEATTRDTNHVLVEGLNPDTEYTYQIEINGRDFTTGPLYDSTFDASGRYMGIHPGNGRYDLRFRTFPDQSCKANLNFAALGDYGVGIHKYIDGYRQHNVARALQLAVDEYDIRLVLTTGDNVYQDLARGLGTGDEDDDWFYSFYQPYRYILPKIPFYPSIGNHDTGDTEEGDDRLQLIDNFHLQRRFYDKSNAATAIQDASVAYRFRFGKLVEFVCLDSSWDEETGRRFIELPEHQDFIKHSLGLDSDSMETPRWYITFAHHPPFCAGPKYGNDETLLNALVPLLQEAARQQGSGYIMLSGHEHNFQHSQVEGVHYFITGAGGKLRQTHPTKFSAAHTIAWAATPHFLLVEISARHLSATPIGRANGDHLIPLHLSGPHHKTVRTPILISHPPAH